MLWQNVEQFVVANSAVKNGTASDLLSLKGKGAGMGNKTPGRLVPIGFLLSGLGLDMDKDLKLMYVGYTPTADALANGQIIAAGMPSVHQPAPLLS